MYTYTLTTFTYIHVHTLKKPTWTHDTGEKDSCTSSVPGIYPGVMTNAKWLTARKRENWDDFVETCPNEAKKHDKVPNWARKSLGMDTSLGRAPQAFPLVWQYKTDEILLSKLQCGMEVSPAGIADTISDLLIEYNAQIKQVNDEIQDYNGQLGEDSEEKQKPLPLASCSLSKGNLEKLAARFARRFSWSYFKNEKPGRHLEFNDPALVKIRKFIQQSIASGKTRERLVANWDQIWTLSYEPLKKVAWRSPHTQGLKADSQKMPRKADFIQGLREKAGLPPVTLDIHR